MHILQGTGKKFSFLLVLVFLSLLPVCPLSAQSMRRGDALTVKLAVRGPGDELYFWFGHIGLVVEDNATGQVRFYDWGVFSFYNDNFFYIFAFGRLLYSCMVTRAETNYNEYISKNRDLTLYTLDLPPEKKEEILHFAERNVLPENRDYYYHHFEDNCATRVRDILDMAVDGQLKARYGSEPGRFSFRQHVRRHTWHNQFFDWILNFWMGQDIDRPITVWDEMFLPSEIAMRAMEFHYTDAGGKDRALVSSVEVLNRSKGRPAVLDVPRIQWPRELMFSVFISGLIVLLYLFRGKEKGFMVFMGVLQSLLGLFFGIAGSALFFMSFFTNHDYTYHNSNIFFVNPLLLAIIPIGIIYAFTKDAKRRFVAARLLRAFWTYVVLGGLLTMVIKLSPSFYQQNQVDQALVMPLAFTLLVIMARLGRFRK